MGPNRVGGAPLFYKSTEAVPLSEPLCCLWNAEPLILTYLLSYSTQQSPSWAKRFSAIQEIPRILWNPKVHYRSHKCTSPVPILRQHRAGSGQSMPPHPTSWRSILILSSHLRLGFPSGFFPSGFPTKILYTPLPSPIRATCPTHLILLNFFYPNNTGWAVQFVQLLIM